MTSSKQFAKDIAKELAKRQRRRKWLTPGVVAGLIALAITYLRCGRGWGIGKRNIARIRQSVSAAIQETFMGNNFSRFDQETALVLAARRRCLAHRLRGSHLHVWA